MTSYQIVEWGAPLARNHYACRSATGACAGRGWAAGAAPPACARRTSSARAAATHACAGITGYAALKRAVGGLTGGVAASVDYVGMPQTTMFAIDTLRRGCTHVVVGLYGGALDMPMPNIIYKLLNLRGSHVGTPQDLAELIELRRAGRIEPPPIAERPLSEVNDVLTELTEGRIEGRVVLRP